ncbi:MAG: tautomerase family protein [Steroidobacteraceae bacterium]
MPMAHLNLLRGHPRESLKEVVRQVSAAMIRVLDAPADRLEVWITEVDPDLWGVRGVPASEALLSEPMSAIEMPFVQLVLMQGRPLAQLHALMAEITDVLVRVLGCERERIRVHIADADPDKWGIGGQPASVRRAAELAARRAG